MNILEFNRDQLNSRLQNLDEWKQLAFALSICERLFPNYVAFARETSWGKPEEIRECLDTTWRRLSDENPQLRLAEAAESCEAAAPDTEDFKSRYTSAALDAALSTANLVRLLGSFDREKILEIAESGYDAANLFTYTDTESASIVTAEDEQKALRHPVVQSELQNQNEDIELLAELVGTFAENESVLRVRWKDRKPLTLGETS